MKIMRLEEVTIFPEIRDLTPEELAEAYRLAREAFTAADLQKYTELFEDSVSTDDVLQQMEEQQARFNAQRNQS
jgi:hypothetical protein